MFVTPVYLMLLQLRINVIQLCLWYILNKTPEVEVEAWSLMITHYSVQWIIMLHN